MNLHAAVRALYPDALDEDFQLRDDADGRGPYLALWHEAKLGPAPTTAALRAEALQHPEPEPPAPRAKPQLVETDDFRARRSQPT